MNPKLRLCGTVLAAAVLLSGPVFSQRGGPATQPGAGNSSSTSGRGTPTGPGTPSQPGQTSPGEPTIPNPPIFFSGRVMLEDGGAPPSRVAIQRICGTSQHTEAYANRDGYFSFQLGQNLEIPDASDSSFGTDRDPFSTATSSGAPALSGAGSRTNLGGGGFGSGPDRRLLGCELRAQLAGYQSQTVDLSSRQPMDNPDLGVILLHRLGGSEGTTISATTLAAPKDARKSYEKGMALARKNKLTEAQAELEKAVGLYPRYAAAWSDLGRVQAAQGKTQDARKSFSQAIQADEKYVRPYIQLARLQLQTSQWEDLAATTEKAIKLDPFTYPNAFFWNAIANYNLHNIPAAEESVRRAQKLDPRHQIPQSSHLLGVILAERHDYSGAAEQMRDYLKFAPAAQDAAAVRSQLEQLERLAQAQQ